MKQYTERELDKKIHAFITSKVSIFPDVVNINAGTVPRTQSSRKRTSLLYDPFSLQLKPIFK